MHAISKQKFPWVDKSLQKLQKPSRISKHCAWRIHPENFFSKRFFSLLKVIQCSRLPCTIYKHLVGENIHKFNIVIFPLYHKSRSFNNVTSLENDPLLENILRFLTPLQIQLMLTFWSEWVSFRGLKMASFFYLPSPTPKLPMIFTKRK